MCRLMSRLTGPRAKPSRFFSARQHVDELAAAREQAVQQLGGFVGQGPWLRAHALGEFGEDAGIQGVGLGQPAQGLDEVAHLARIHHGDGEPGLGERDGGEHLEAAGGLQDDERGGQSDESRGKLGQAQVVIGDGPTLPVGERGDVERGFRHIDADVAVHKVPPGKRRSTWPNLA